jgi:iron complex outermembrane receptor protein
MSVTISKQAFGQEQSQQSLSPVYVEPPSHRSGSVTPRSDSGQRAKSRRARRAVRREVPASGASSDVAVNIPATQPADGSVAAGYRVDDVKDVGPFTNMKLQDTPYSVSVLSADFLKNTQSYATPESFADKFPSFQVGYTDQRPITGSGNFRGIGAPDQQLVEGLPVPGTSSLNFLEPFERVEALSSVSGFMYGVGSSTGKFNYVLKRPTADPFFANIMTGVMIGTSPYGYADFGGNSPDGRVGYRFNVVGQTGNTNVDNQSQQKYLVSGAFDFHLSERALLQIDASYSRWNGTSPSAWLVAPGVKFSTTPIPDPSKLWSQPWSYVDTTTATVGGKFTAELTDNITSRTSVRYFREPYGSIFINNTIQPNNTYNQTIFAIDDSYTHSTIGAYQYFDIKFDTGSIHHKVTTGIRATSTTESEAADYFGITAGGIFNGLPLGYPTYLPKPTFNIGTQPVYTFEDVRTRDYVIGDQIDFNKHWSALIGLTYATIHDQTFETTGAQATNYDVGKATPTVALMYKPVEWLTTYGSYVQGLQQGVTVVGPQFTNNGSVLPPYLREQYEVGAKATVGNVFYTLALFQIDSASQYLIDNGDGTLTYRQDGRQRNRGVELSATGQIAPGLRVLSGLSYIDARILKDDSNPSLVGKTAQNVANWLFKNTIEYDVTPIPGFTLTGGAYYTSGFYADIDNTDRVSGRVLFDAGFRYATKIAERPAILRFNVSNLFNERYWVGVSVLGEPRRFAGTMEMKF